MGICGFCGADSTFSDLSYESLREAITSLKSSFAAISNAHEMYGHPVVREVIP